MRRYIAPVLLFLHSIITHPASASECYSNDQILELYCLTTAAEYGELTANQIIRLNILLAEYGYHPESQFKTSTSLSIRPLVEYDNNINGGNPSGDLVLGQIRLSMDQRLEKQDDYALGVVAKGQVRKIFSAGSWGSVNLTGQKAYGLTHGITKSYIGGIACYNEHLKSWLYVTGCIEATSKEKLISSTEKRSSKLALAKYFKSPIGHAKAMVAFDAPIFGATESEEVASLSLLQSFPQSTTVELAIGKVDGARNKRTVSIEKELSRSISTSVKYTFSEQLPLLGHKREETDLMMQISIKTKPNSQLMIGYRSSDNTIDYFDNAYPFVSFTQAF